MPFYEYRSNDGDSMEVFAHMAEAPAFGHEIKARGKAFHRVPSIVRAAVERETHFMSQSLPDWIPGASRYNAEGQPQFGSKQEVKDFLMKRADMEFCPKPNAPITQDFDYEC